MIKMNFTYISIAMLVVLGLIHLSKTHPMAVTIKSFVDAGIFIYCAVYFQLSANKRNVPDMIYFGFLAVFIAIVITGAP